jgi:hypothetical protein
MSILSTPIELPGSDASSGINYGLKQNVLRTTQSPRVLPQSVPSSRVPSGGSTGGGAPAAAAAPAHNGAAAPSSSRSGASSSNVNNNTKTSTATTTSLPANIRANAASAAGSSAPSVSGTPNLSAEAPQGNRNAHASSLAPTQKNNSSGSNHMNPNSTSGSSFPTSANSTSGVNGYATPRKGPDLAAKRSTGTAMYAPNAGMQAAPAHAATIFSSPYKNPPWNNTSPTGPAQPASPQAGFYPPNLNGFPRQSGTFGTPQRVMPQLTSAHTPQYGISNNNNSNQYAYGAHTPQYTTSAQQFTSPHYTQQYGNQHQFTAPQPMQQYTAQMAPMQRNGYFSQYDNVNGNVMLMGMQSLAPPQLL